MGQLAVMGVVVRTERRSVVKEWLDLSQVYGLEYLKRKPGNETNYSMFVNICSGEWNVDQRQLFFSCNDN